MSAQWQPPLSPLISDQEDGDTGAIPLGATLNSTVAGAAIDTVDSPVTFSEQDVDISTSGFTNPNDLDGLTIEDVASGNHVLDLSASLVGTAGVFTFDLTDVAAAVANAYGTPLDSASHTHTVTISDSVAVEEASATIVINPPAGWFRQELASVTDGAGSFANSESWFKPLPADTSPIMFASVERVDTADPSYFDIAANGNVSTNILSGSVAATIFDITGEMIRAGQFEDGTETEWATLSGLTISGGKANFVAVTGNFSQILLAADLDIVVGGTYEFIITTSGVTVGDVTIELINGTTVSGTARSTNNTFTESLVALSGNTQFSLSADNFTGSVDSISVRRADVNGGIWKPFTIDIADAIAAGNGTNIGFISSFGRLGVN